MFFVIPRLDPRISSQINLELPSGFLRLYHLRILEFLVGILDFSGVLGAAAPKGLGRSPYKICGAGLPH